MRKLNAKDIKRLNHFRVTLYLFLSIARMFFLNFLYPTTINKHGFLLHIDYLGKRSFADQWWAGLLRNLQLSVRCPGCLPGRSSYEIPSQQHDPLCRYWYIWVDRAVIPITIHRPIDGRATGGKTFIFSFHTASHPLGSSSSLQIHFRRPGGAARRKREGDCWLWTVNDFEPAPPLSICYPNNNYCPFIIRWTMTFPLISTATHRARYDLLTTYRE